MAEFTSEAAAATARTPVPFDISFRSNTTLSHGPLKTWAWNYEEEAACGNHGNHERVKHSGGVFSSCCDPAEDRVWIGPTAWYPVLAGARGWTVPRRKPPPPGVPLYWNAFPRWAMGRFLRKGRDRSCGERDV
ncbi:hypothetical protein SKAU_G00420150 [Synaphobranchus kaupii]|uniref:Uncharacterized protein n=1 Tax=Synaphobranchus kaupii TaxID=118154 RepID=A0A9Q1IB35_SYNKA|nr:hypothetical protein SKAU_G00420150 [Synaphobranchus kaupii]